MSKETESVDQEDKGKQDENIDVACIEWLKKVTQVTPEKALGQWLQAFIKLPKKPPTAEIRTFANNEDKNRYNDIPCIDQSRVVIQNGEDDYIHANYVAFPEKNVQLILAQAPKLNTIEQFWRMVMQEKVTNIACLTSLEEQGVEKCVAYWPLMLGSKGKQKFGDFSLRCRGRIRNPNYILSIIEVKEVKDKKVSNKLLIRHLYFLNWPDKKVPNCTHAFMHFTTVCMAALKDPVMPGTKQSLLIHCSAGVGRSGTLAAVMIMDSLLNMHKKPIILSLVTELRKQRANCVQSHEQYLFLYRALFELISNRKIIPADMSSGLGFFTTAIREKTTRSDCDLTAVKIMKSKSFRRLIDANALRNDRYGQAAAAAGGDQELPALLRRSSSAPPRIGGSGGGGGDAMVKKRRSGNLRTRSTRKKIRNLKIQNLRAAMTTTWGGVDVLKMVKDLKKGRRATKK